MEDRGTEMKVGYIGLGTMGGALARRLMVSRPLVVFDHSAAAVSALAAEGATPATSPAAMAACCDVILICVPRSENVREVLFGADGLAAGLDPGKIVVDQTSGDPAQTRAMAAALAEHGVSMLDAPVSGGPTAAEAGTIAIMVGGEEQALEKVRPVLGEISSNITRCGGIGAGQVMKVINNTISTCNRFAMLEGVAMGLRSGLDLSTMAEVLNKGGARSKSSETLLVALAKGVPNAKFALALMLKDLNLASHIAVESGAPLQFGHLARAMLQMAHNQLGPDANIDDIVEIVAEQAGVSFR
jgi:3-hydroxyisobutyrate dehydrogenase